jgi:hypothetical protein
VVAIVLIAKNLGKESPLLPKKGLISLHLAFVSLRGVFTFLKITSEHLINNENLEDTLTNFFGSLSNVFEGCVEILIAYMIYRMLWPVQSGHADV